MTILHQIGIRASSCQVCFSFKVLFFKKKKKEKKNPFKVNEDLGTNLFSQEKENDASQDMTSKVVVKVPKR